MSKQHYPPLMLEDTMPFGKHKGEEVQWVIEEDPDYIEWCIENVDGFELSNEAYKAYIKKNKTR